MPTCTEYVGIVGYLRFPDRNCCILRTYDGFCCKLRMFLQYMFRTWQELKRKMIFRGASWGLKGYICAHFARLRKMCCWSHVRKMHKLRRMYGVCTIYQSKMDGGTENAESAIRSSQQKPSKNGVCPKKRVRKMHDFRIVF